ncbi:MAG: ATP-binding protein [Deltaproteobacteria bacterium]|nr:ATP-binding protein [Deltaproteobacteria bacterium]
MYKRILNNVLSELDGASCFIFGPRQTGKSTILKDRKADLYIDLLSHENFLKYSNDPDILWREIKQLPKQKQEVIIDGEQKVPAILDVVHRAIEDFKHIHFLLSGSSMRKIRRGAANLLGGRAINLNLFSLTHEELADDFNLEEVLEYGSLPQISSLLAENNKLLAAEMLNSYVATYLLDEIKAEAIVRSLASFQSFLRVAASQYAKEINFSAIASNSRLPQSSINNYYSILEDTLIGFFLEPYTRSIRTRLSKRKKFYFYDNGVARAILGLEGSIASPEERGNLFEQWLIAEAQRINSYYRKKLTFNFWRTSSGAEVDLLISRANKILLAIEIKSDKNIAKRDCSGLFSFHRENPKVPCYICAPVDQEQSLEKNIELITPQTLTTMIKQA